MSVLARFVIPGSTFRVGCSYVLTGSQLVKPLFSQASYTEQILIYKNGLNSRNTENSAVWSSSTAGGGTGYTATDPDKLRSVSQVVSYPGDEGGVHLHG